MKTTSFPSMRRQQGASLVVVLILLLVMTLLGLAVLRSALLEERMTANLLDRSWSFQAAEAALPDLVCAGASVSVFQAPQAGHWPDHFAVSLPHSVQ